MSRFGFACSSRHRLRFACRRRRRHDAPHDVADEDALTARQGARSDEDSRDVPTPPWVDEVMELLASDELKEDVKADRRAARGSIVLQAIGYVIVVVGISFLALLVVSLAHSIGMKDPQPAAGWAQFHRATTAHSDVASAWSAVQIAGTLVVALQIARTVSARSRLADIRRSDASVQTLRVALAELDAASRRTNWTLLFSAVVSSLAVISAHLGTLMSDDPSTQLMLAGWAVVLVAAGIGFTYQETDQVAVALQQFGFASVRAAALARHLKVLRRRGHGIVSARKSVSGGVRWPRGRRIAGLATPLACLGALQMVPILVGVKAVGPQRTALYLGCALVIGTEALGVVFYSDAQAAPKDLPGRRPDRYFSVGLGVAVILMAAYLATVDVHPIPRLVGVLLAALLTLLYVRASANGRFGGLVRMLAVRRAKSSLAAVERSLQRYRKALGDHDPMPVQ